MKFSKYMEVPNSASAMFQEDVWLSTGSLIVGIAVILLAMTFRGYYQKTGETIGVQLGNAFNTEVSVPNIPTDADKPVATEWYAWVSEIPSEKSVGQSGSEGNTEPEFQLNITTRKPKTSEAYAGKICKNNIISLKIGRPLDSSVSLDTVIKLYDPKSDLLLHITKIYCPDKVKMPENMAYTFMNCCDLKDIRDLKNFDMSGVKNVSSMFSGCTSIEHFYISNWDTSNIVNMSGMFMSCHSLKMLDLSTFDTRNVENMESMFEECTSLIQLNISGFDVRNVKNTGCMFALDGKLKTLYAPVFDLQNIENYEKMFWLCNESAIPVWYKK